MTDVEQIQALLFSYCHGYDSGDVELVKSLWSPDAVMITPKGEQPYEALLRFSEGAAGWKGKGRHLIHNPLVRVNGDRADFSAYWVVIGLPESGPTVAGTGSYKGEAKKTASGWKINRWALEAIAMNREALGQARGTS